MISTLLFLALQSPAPEAAPPPPAPAPESSPAPEYTPVAPLPPRPGTPLVEKKPDKPAVEKKPALKRLLVMDLVDKGAGPEVSAAISQAIAAQALKSHGGEVVTTEQVRVALDAAATAALVGCESERCMSDVAKQVEADLVLAGSVAKVGDDVLITLLVVNARDGARVADQTRKVPQLKDLYYYAAQQLTALALTGKATDARVPVRVVADQPEASVVIDGQKMGPAPHLASLEPGVHEVRVELDGFAPWRTQITVEEATPMQLQANLVEKGTDLWPAAVVTAGVGGATAIGGLLLGLAAQDAYSGSVGLFGSPERSYLGASPASSAELASRKQDVQRLALAADTLWVLTAVAAASSAALFTLDLLAE